MNQSTDQILNNNPIDESDQVTSQFQSNIGSNNQDSDQTVSQNQNEIDASETSLKQFLNKLKGFFFPKRSKRNEELRSQIEALSNDVSNIIAKIQTIDETVVRINNGMDALKQELNQSTEIDPLQKPYQAIAQLQSSINTMNQGLNQTVSQIQSRIDATDNGMKQVMAQLQSRMDASDQSMQQGMAQLQSSVEALSNGSNQAMAKLQYDIDALKQEIKGKQGGGQNVDAMMPLIKLYTQNAIRQKDKGDSPEIYAVQATIKADLQMMGITMHPSSPGTSFDPHTMKVAQCEFVLTNKRELENTVAESVVPAFRKEGATGELIQYEQVALFKYDEHATMVSTRHDEILPPPSAEKVVGFLAYRYDDEIRAIYEVYEGSNVFGTNPKVEEGRHSYRIPVKEGEGVEREHFEICENKMRLLSGTWGIDCFDDKAEKELDACNTLCVCLSEHVSFVYYEK